jgi:hypothetical protein
MLALGVAATGCFFGGLLVNGSPRLALASVAAAGLLVAVAFRRKAPRVDGAMWSASADLMRDGSRFPGELSLLSNAVVWMPSKFSRRRGLDGAVRLAVDEQTELHFEAGPALLDVLVSVRSADGQTVRFTTHRSPGLAEAIRRIGATDPHQ